jgi:hypothetical protein
MNAKWHEQHKLPRGASVEQRMEWHREHQQQCGCRPIPARLLEQMQEQEVKPPAASLADTKFSNVVLAFADLPSVSYGGKGFGSNALKLSGKIFAMLTSRGEFAVKLPKQRVEELVEQGKGRYFDPGHGRLMKEWFVAGPASTRWVDLAREAHESASSRPTRLSRPPSRASMQSRSAKAKATKPRTRG